MKNIRLYLFPLVILGLLSAFSSCCSSRTAPDSGPLVFMVASDMGRRGESEQRNIAGIMGRFAEQDSVAFLIVAGDPIHDEGVTGIDDPEWEAKIESVYTHPALDLPWWVISGNHEYRGNVQAVLDYSRVKERWNAPARYYSFDREIPGTDLECLFVFVDTPPLMDKYRAGTKYPSATEQDMEAQLHWLDSVLLHSPAHWKIVTGHHPVYAHTQKDETERIDMQQRVGKILEQRGADLYICGHIHNFQHIKPDNGRVHYIVNSSASQSREVQPIEGTVYCNGDPGFSLYTVTPEEIDVRFVNHEDRVIYRMAVQKW